MDNRISDIFHDLSYRCVNKQHNLTRFIMKHVLWIMFFSILSSPVYSSIFNEEHHYTKEEIEYYRLVQTITIIDWAQTIHIASEPEHFEELNPFLGKHPSLTEVHRFGIARMAIQHLLFISAPDLYRKTAMIEFAILGALAVINNQHYGVDPYFKIAQSIPLVISYTWKF